MSYIYHTVKNIGGKKTLANYNFAKFFGNLTFPMQMDFNSVPKVFSAKIPTVLIRQTFLPPKFLLYGICPSHALCSQHWIIFRVPISATIVR